MTSSTPVDTRADLPGLQNRYLIPSDQTDGRFAIIEHTIAPKTLAAPLHTHRNEDEYSYVVSGRMGAIIGDDVIEAQPGQLVVKPRGIPHAFWNASDAPTVVLETISPGGFEQYFADLAPLLITDGDPDFEAMTAIQARYALTMDFTSIADLIERFDLRTDH